MTNVDLFRKEIPAIGRVYIRHYNIQIRHKLFFIKYTNNKNMGLLSFLTGNKKTQKKYFFVFTEDETKKEVKGVVLGITYGPIPNKKDIELLKEFYGKEITNIFKTDELKFNSLKEKGYPVITI